MKNNNCKEKIEELTKAKENAEKKDIEKSYFLAQASHDLRQPLEAIEILAEDLLNEKLSIRQKNIVKKLQKSAENLSELLANFLDISKLESGGFEKDFEIFDIGLLLQSLYSEFLEIAKSKKIKIEFSKCKQEIKSDPVLIERIIRNFVSNAIKYTKNKITLKCHKDKSYALISVIDNGIGIDKEDIPHIFDEFYQSKKIKDNHKTGAGLGLNIANRIALLINSQIEVNSETNKGSEFTLKIPLK